MKQLQCRFDVYLPAELAQDMQDLKQQTGLLRNKIFRRAIALYRKALQTHLAKGNVILRDSNGTLHEVVGLR